MRPPEPDPLPLRVNVINGWPPINPSNHLSVERERRRYCKIAIGQPFMTSTRRGRGCQAYVDACGRCLRGQAPRGRPHRKYLSLSQTSPLAISLHSTALSLQTENTAL